MRNYLTFLSGFGTPASTAWTVISTEGDYLRFIQTSPDKISGKPRVAAFGETSLPDQRDLSRAAKSLRIPRSGKRALLLGEPDYRIHMVDAPNVPPSELKAAMKWRLKEIIDFPVEEASYDILDLPADRRGSDQSHNVYAVAAKREVLRRYVERLDKARLPVSVIDIPETAQRNIAALYEEENRAVAFLYLGESDALLTVSAQRELYLARRLDISLAQIRKVEGDARSDLFYRIMLELQRTLDNFERQFSFVAIGKLLLGPEPEETGLRDYLIANLGIKVEAADLATSLGMPPGRELDAPVQWRYFHLIGCSLRTGAAVQ